MERQGSFRHGIVALLPELRAFARFLTRDASRADDLVQEALVRAFASRGQFAADTNLKAWLFTILRNLFYEQARRRKREREILDEYGDQALSLNAHDDASDELSDLNNMLWKLPDAQREALMLVGAQGMSYEEAAAICGVTVGTLRSRVFRGRRFLCELSGGWESVF
ncbi:sigma-70 family RNA polymerase sigma factor [Acetobacter conturbans]|uniref:RNA polymerase sigma factor n=1 Tax=Acetobacter conturbans TaxID=1737472 RepID=A0ABX0K879_9PROT|nr:sigma-70 family RNA polymerase sigma factor [Acetobacter conturbans]NHN90142.1 sigma-70 family RNA polymerase sigma factor [Acetobacter conturbans]